MENIIEKLTYICTQYNVYLYGAGIYARTLCAFIKEKNIGEIEKFIVSRSLSNSKLLKKEIIVIEQYAALEKSVSNSLKENMIVIAVSEQYYPEIIKELRNKQIEHYIMLTNEEWKIVMQETRFDDIVPQKNIAILMYHRIIDSDYNFWKLNVSPTIFEKHIKYLSENYQILRLEDAWIDTVKSDQKYVGITFDDGYVDNFRFALPILEKYQVPATVFVSTDLIDTDEMYWWDELEKIFILDHYIGEFIFADTFYKVTNVNDSKEVCIAIRCRLKEMTPTKRKKCMGELREALRVEQSLTSELRCVNTEELTAMAESPYITIGGHTKSHLSLGEQHPEKLLRSEIEESLKILRKKTGEQVKIFAYPFGGREDWCKKADSIMAECGIIRSVLACSGNISVSDPMYNLPRHMVFAEDDIEKKLKRIWGIYG